MQNETLGKKRYVLWWNGALEVGGFLWGALNQMKSTLSPDSEK